MAFLYWKTYFDNILPPGADGVMVILESSCGQQYTYRVDGDRSTFLGNGDLHDRQYEYLQTGIKMESILEDGAHSKDQGCRYSIRVYPSKEFEDKYHTNSPWVYSVIIGALFFFSTIVFCTYDFMVERRQKVVLESAMKSGALVSSLFPEAVREQLYEEQKVQGKQSESRDAWMRSKNESNEDRKEAIAHLYNETTIFFADIVGFTQWSKKRTPADVFLLLETLYGSFDRIAERRGVFKVETIGDW